MDWRKAFPSDYVASWDIENKPIDLEIESVKVCEVGHEKEKRPVIYFVGTKKGMVLNKTNGKTIAALVDSNKTEDWIGKRVQLFVTQCDAFGTITDCIRIRAAGTE